MLTHYTDDPMMRLLVNRTRLAVTAGHELAALHRAIGSLLAADVARLLPLEDYEIEHSKGPSSGVRVQPGRHPAIIALLRAGLFVAEGLWERFPGSALLLHGAGLDPFAEFDINNRTTVIVDAVINTGRSITPVIEEAAQRGAAAIMVVSLVSYRPTLEAMAAAMPHVAFTTARLSERSYVGQGSTDTGSRLFGTAS